MPTAQVDHESFSICNKQIYRVGQKRGYRHMTVIVSIPNRFMTFFTGRFLGKFAIKWISKIPSHLAYVATLPCETKRAINDKLQGTVAKYF